MDMRRGKIVEDNLGKYEVLNTGKNGRPTTIRYVIDGVSVIGSLTTRKRDLKQSKHFLKWVNDNIPDEKDNASEGL